MLYLKEGTTLERSERTSELAGLAALLYPHVNPGTGETRTGLAVNEAMRLLAEAEGALSRSLDVPGLGLTPEQLRAEELETGMADYNALHVETPLIEPPTPEEVETAMVARGVLRPTPDRPRRGTVETIRPATAEEVAAIGKQVRERRNYGACQIMGTFVRQTATGFTYVDREGRTRRSSFRRQQRFAGETAPRPHVEPCANCPEHRDPNACIHGRAGFCETCLST